MPFWCMLLLLCSVIPNISTKLLGEDHIACTGGFCLPKHICPKGNYEEFNPQNPQKIIIEIGEEDECLDYMLYCCKNETKIFTNLKCPGGYCVSKDVCAKGGRVTSNPQDTGLITLRVGEKDVCRKNMQICCKTATKYSSNQTAAEPPLNTCGKNNPDGLVYQVRDNRTYAQYAEFPWMVAIFKLQENFVGSGSLIHPRFVLSVAHIFNSKTQMFARFGEWDIAGNQEPFPIQDIKIQPDIFIHPQYNEIGYSNNIALALLEQEVVYQQHIRPICLPNPSDVFDGQRCTATGWGADVRTNEYATILKRIDLPVVPREQCQRMLRVTRLGLFFQLHSSVICAGGEPDVDMCDGDGGSPLVCPTKAGTHVLAGIVSWGIGCNQKEVPGGYVNVAMFVEWIKSTLERV